MIAIYKKELRSYFINPIGYIFCGIFLALAALLCCYTTVLSSSYDVKNYFQYMMFAMAILIPLLTMRSFSEERKMRTEQLLLTAPVSLVSVVTGKFLAAFTLFGGATLLSCLNFIPIYAVAAAERGAQEYQNYHVGPVTAQLFGCLVAILLLGAAFIAIGTFVSALTENQLAAAVVTIAVLVALLGISLLNTTIDTYWLRAVLSWVSVYSRYAAFMNGVFDFAALLYYLSITFVFLFLTVRVYEKRRWS